MKLQYILSLILIGIIFLLLAIPSVYKVNKKHNDNLIYATTSKITNIAKTCYYEQNCKSNKITLKELYRLKLINEMINPLTNEYYNENSYVLIEKDKIEFIEGV